jgi:hypothetical protein
MPKRKDIDNSDHEANSDKESTKSKPKKLKSAANSKVQGKTKPIDDFEQSVSSSRSIIIPFIMDKPKDIIRTCFHCRKKSKEGSPVVWGAPCLKVFNVWLCNNHYCRINFWRGDGWHGSGNHTFCLCHTCDNIMFKSDVFLEYPCLCCGLNPRAVYKKEVIEEKGFRRILKNTRLEMIEDYKLKKVNITTL